MKKIVIAVAILFLFVVFLIGMYIPVEYSGTEFCPQTFQVRSFDFDRNGFGSKNMHRGTPSPACGVSITNHLQPAAGIIRWDLVTGERGSNTSKAGDSKVLVDYLQATNKTTTWGLDKWTDENPGMAAKLWPRVQWLALNNLYFAIPDLIRYSQSGVTEDSFVKFAEHHTLKAAVQQAQYLLESAPSDDRIILLYRLTQWLNGQSTQVAATEDKDLSERYDKFIEQSKQGTIQLKDGTLSNEVNISPANNAASSGTTSPSSSTPPSTTTPAKP